MEEAPTIELSPDQQEALDTVLRWLDQPQQVMTFGGLAGTGKALAHDQEVQTLEGPRPIADLRVGDFVLGKDGLPTKVVGVFPQGRRQAYRVIFRDGSSVECDEEHLWTVRLQSKPRWTLKTLKSIRQGGLKNSAGYKYKIPLCGPVQYETKELPLDPYALGLFIGDGTSLGKTPTLCVPDVDRVLVSRAAEVVGAGIEVNENRAPNCPQHRFVDTTQRGNRLTSIFRELELDVLSPKRFIPEEYLLGDEQQRWALLRGLMDTDGSCLKNRTSFSTSSERLASDVVRLVQSLGGTAIKHAYTRSDGAVDFQINVKTFRCPFALQRKAQHWRPSAKNPPSRYIVDIQPSRVCDHVCIKVDAADGLFLTKDFIVTHNTTLIKQLMAHVPYAEIVAFTGKAVSVLRAKGVYNAKTLHSLIYLPAGEDDEGDPIFKRRAKIDAQLVIVDEASMINRRMHEDLEFLARKILYVGDHGQLEPIGYDPGLMHDPFIRLEKIHRQAADSPILQFAYHLRQGGDPFDRNWAKGKAAPLRGRYVVGDHDDVIVSHSWPNDISTFDTVIVGFNGKRHYLNRMIREERGFEGLLPKVGETLICLHNHRDFGIFNGMQVVVEKCEQRNQEVAELHWIDEDNKKRHVPIYLPQLGTSEKFSRDEYLRTSFGLFDWGYSLTCHKAQGSEFDRVCVIETQHKGWDPARWRYTASTRAAKELYYVVEGRRLKL